MYNLLKVKSRKNNAIYIVYNAIPILAKTNYKKKTRKTFFFYFRCQNLDNFVKSTNPMLFLR